PSRNPLPDPAAWACAAVRGNTARSAPANKNLDFIMATRRCVHTMVYNSKQKCKRLTFGVANQWGQTPLIRMRPRRWNQWSLTPLISYEEAAATESGDASSD